MERRIDMEEISDGKLYKSQDMVRAGAGNCEGCSDCCRGMGNSIILDPFDVYNITNGLGISFEEMLAKEYVQLNVVEGIILPNLTMKKTGEYQKVNGEITTDACVFLNEKGRCSIHPLRPGMCRLFPLGRIYDGETFSYFLQTKECSNKNRIKVRVKQWLGIDGIDEYEKYICDWHYFLKDMTNALVRENDEQLSKKVNMFLLNLFYIKQYDTNTFYKEFYCRMETAKKLLG